MIAKSYLLEWYRMFTDALGRKQQNVELIVFIQDNYETQMTITYNKSPNSQSLTPGAKIKPSKEKPYCYVILSIWTPHINTNYCSYCSPLLYQTSEEPQLLSWKRKGWWKQWVLWMRASSEERNHRVFWQLCWKFYHRKTNQLWCTGGGDLISLQKGKHRAT